MLWANFLKLFSNLIAFTYLHTVSHYLPLCEFCGEIFKNILFLDLLVQKLFFNKNH